MFPDPRRLASAIDNGVHENNVTRNSIENRKRKPFGKRTMIIPVHHTMNAAVNPQRFNVSR